MGTFHSIGLHILSSDLHIVLNDTCPFNCKKRVVGYYPQKKPRKMWTEAFSESSNPKPMYVFRNGDNSKGGKYLVGKITIPGYFDSKAEI
jgi:hypothetical protein